MQSNRLFQIVILSSILSCSFVANAVETAGGPAASQASSPITWKTFKSDLGWSFEYPADWTVADTAPEVPLKKSALIQISSKVVEGKYGYIEFSQLPEANKDTAEKSIEGNKKDSLNEKILSEKKIEVGHEPASQITFKSLRQKNSCLIATLTYVRHLNHLFYTSFGDCEVDMDHPTFKSPADWKYQAVYDHFISSIRFQKPKN